MTSTQVAAPSASASAEVWAAPIFANLLAPRACLIGQKSTSQEPSPHLPMRGSRGWVTSTQVAAPSASASAEVWAAPNFVNFVGAARVFDRPKVNKSGTVPDLPMQASAGELGELRTFERRVEREADFGGRSVCVAALHGGRHGGHTDRRVGGTSARGWVTSTQVAAPSASASAEVWAAPNFVNFVGAARVFDRPKVNKSGTVPDLPMQASCWRRARV
jgi:hypothetical protein